MLVLTRGLNERIMIGDDIVITVVDIRGDKIRLGIDAPVDVQVHREEVHERIKCGEPRRMTDDRSRQHDG